ncbi:vomeronasal type-2 receptor 116-like [Tenrec ecaudatus]|uniref:vomeronasal type-2 receptor 116-like n=1 Tax=Tenrec ecaudatus TaxID=94439 RepID=UPI003F59FB26
MAAEREVELPDCGPAFVFASCVASVTPPSVYRDGDLVLGGFFPLYMLTHELELHWKFFMTHSREDINYDWFNYRGYNYVLGFLFAIEEINRSPHLLPNMSLGFRLYNAYPSDVSTLKSALGWLSEREPPIPNFTCQKHTKSMAVIVILTSVFSMQIGALLELYRTPQLHQVLQRTQLENSAGEHVSLGENRSEMSRYEIFNYLNFPEGFELQVKVGELVSKGLHGHSLMIQEELIEWATGFEETPHSLCSKSCGPGSMKIPQEGMPVCCFYCILCPERGISNQTDSDQCTACPQSQYPDTERTRCLPKSVTFLAYQDPLGMALACTALCFSVVTAMVLGVFVKYRDSPMVKANNRTLSYVLLLSLLLCFLCSLLFIGRPNAVTCILSNISFAVIFTVAVSTVLAKTITVILAFKVVRPGGILRQLLVSGVVNSVVPFCSLIQMIICGIWLGTSPPFIDIDTSSDPRSIIIVCNKGSVTAFYCVLGYLGFLALGTFSLAYQARNLPDTFNEAKFLTFSMLVFCSVWVTFLPVYHSTQGKVMVAVEIFSILASSVGLLGCIFAPKCYVIFLRPDRNTSKGLKNKTYKRRQ